MVSETVSLDAIVGIYAKRTESLAKPFDSPSCAALTTGEYLGRVSYARAVEASAANTTCHFQGNIPLTFTSIYHMHSSHRRPGVGPKLYNDQGEEVNSSANIDRTHRHLITLTPSHSSTNCTDDRGCPRYHQPW